MWVKNLLLAGMVLAGCRTHVDDKDGVLDTASVQAVNTATEADDEEGIVDEGLSGEPDTASDPDTSGDGDTDTGAEGDSSDSGLEDTASGDTSGDTGIVPGDTDTSDTSADDDTASRDTGTSDTGDPGEDADADCADDLSEGLGWICTEGTEVALNYAYLNWEERTDVDTSSWDGSDPDPEDVAVTGDNVVSDWSYDAAYAVNYDSVYGWMWFDFSTPGYYRVTWNSEYTWALYGTWCESSDASDLCHENADTSWSTCLYSDGSDISIPTDSDCEALESP